MTFGKIYTYRYLDLIHMHGYRYSKHVIVWMTVHARKRCCMMTLHMYDLSCTQFIKIYYVWPIRTTKCEIRIDMKNITDNNKLSNWPNQSDTCHGLNFTSVTIRIKLDLCHNAWVKEIKLTCMKLIDHDYINIFITFCVIQ